MGLFDRKVRPAFVTPPAERPDQTSVHDRLNALRLIPPWQRHGSWQQMVDDLLDELQADQDAGRVDSIIDNHRENPW